MNITLYSFTIYERTCLQGVQWCQLINPPPIFFWLRPWYKLFHPLTWVPCFVTCQHDTPYITTVTMSLSGLGHIDELRKNSSLCQVLGQQHYILRKHLKHKYPVCMVTNQWRAPLFTTLQYVCNTQTVDQLLNTLL